jgi:hypothetical protein
MYLNFSVTYVLDPYNPAPCPAGPLRPAEVLREGENSLRSDIRPPVSQNLHWAPAAAQGRGAKSRGPPVGCGEERTASKLRILKSGEALRQNSRITPIGNFF